MRHLCIVLLLTCSISTLYAQLAPAAGARLNYNQVMFEHPVLHGVDAYMLQIADSSDHSFKYPVAQVRDSFPASMVSNLKFGKTYLWRYAAISGNKQLEWHGPYVFTIDPDPFLINQNTRLRIIKNDSTKNAGGLVAVDILHSILDRKGNLVWFFPDFKTGPRKGAGTDDLYLNKAGTITTLGGQNGSEFDLVGNQLWITPHKVADQAFSPLGDFYHHDLKRLPNGHYMVIALDFTWKKIPIQFSLAKLMSYSDSSRHHWVDIAGLGRVLSMPGGWVLRHDSTGNYGYMNMSALLEFDKKNNLVWSWKTDSYVSDKDLFPDGTVLEPEEVRQEPHLNGFCVDAKNEYVYLSIKNFSRVIKIEKKTGKVVYSWGRKMNSGEAMDGADFFRHQHAPVILNNGNMALFNNADMREDKEPSSVRVISMPATGKGSEVVWRYDCKFDTSMRKNKSARGGNVEQMGNSNFLVSEGGINRIFEITQDKNIVWNAEVERNTHNDSGWIPYPMYRMHYTSSLYPTYFALQTESDTLLRKKGPITLKIYNAGSENDSYNVTVYSSSNSGSYKVKQNPGTVAGRHSATVSIASTGKPVDGDNVEIIVTSNNNPDIVRKIGLVYK